MAASTGRSTSFFAVVVLSTLAVASARGGLVYKVGDDKGWTILGNVNYSAWVSSKAFKVGDIIGDFSFPSLIYFFSPYSVYFSYLLILFNFHFS